MVTIYMRTAQFFIGMVVALLLILWFPLWLIGLAAGAIWREQEKWDDAGARMEVLIHQMKRKQAEVRE